MNQPASEPVNAYSSRADNARADLERIRGMSDEEFEAQWGEWARRQDKDLQLVRQRWIGDLEKIADYAEQEAAAVAELVEAKAMYRDNPTPETKAYRDAAVAAVQLIRAQERTAERRIGPAGDAFVVGTNPALEG